MPPGSLQPPATIPGTGTVWVLGYFPGLNWRWAALTAGQAPPLEPPPATPKR
jgi:hypothetical protein